MHLYHVPVTANNQCFGCYVFPRANKLDAHSLQISDEEDRLQLTTKRSHEDTVDSDYVLDICSLFKDGFPDEHTNDLETKEKHDL